MIFYHVERFPNDQQTTYRTDFAKPDGTRRGDGLRCVVCGGYIGMKEWLPPYRVELEAWGEGFGDLAMGNAGDDILVSQRVKTLWQEYGLRGLSGFHPVEVVAVKRRKAKGDVPRYYRAKVSFSQTVVDHDASGTVWDHEAEDPLAFCMECRTNPTASGIEAIKRVIIDPKTWSGEDLFIPRGLPDFITSDRFKNFRDEHRITNAVLTRAEDYWFDFRRQGTGQPWKAS
jgi:hypothetical protein